MFVRVILLLVLASGVGFVTFTLVQEWLDEQRRLAQQVVTPVAPPPAEPQYTEVLVAADNLPIGRLLRQEDFRWQPWPDDNLSASYVVRNIGTEDAQFYGAVVRREIVEGEPVTDNAIARPGERGFLAAVLGPGMRAVTIPINPRTGIAGFIYPGDRVDVVFTHAVQYDGIDLLSGEEEAEVFDVSETVLLDMRVLAIDQSLGAPREGGAQLGGLATLEVTPRQAEMISVLLTSGSLSLSLRSLTDPQQPEAIQLARELDRPLPAGAQEEFFGTGAELTPQVGQSFTFVGDVSQLVLTPFDQAVKRRPRWSTWCKRISSRSRRQPSGRKPSKPGVVISTGVVRDAGRGRDPGRAIDRCRKSIIRREPPCSDWLLSLLLCRHGGLSASGRKVAEL